MVSYFIRRFIQAIFIIILVSLIIFLIMHLMPGDPVLLYVTMERYETMSQEQIDFIRHEYGLDKPLFVQYADWVNGLLHGDLGKSLTYQQPVNVLIGRRLPITLHLGLMAMIIGVFFGLVAGVIAAARRGKVMDLVMTLFANIGITIPMFWMGIILIYGFGLKLGWLPIYGYTSPFEDFWQSTKQAIMPVACLAFFTLGAIARQTRSSVLDTIRQDYIRTAWAKGLSERRIILRHVLKNSLIPIVTLLGIQFSGILGGSVLIETVFSIPGMGRLAVEAIQGLDYAIVQAVTFLTAVMVVFVNFVVDISYGWIDPRIRLT